MLALVLIVPLLSYFIIHNLKPGSEVTPRKKPRYAFSKGSVIQLVIARKVTMKDVIEIKRVIKEKGVNQLCFNLSELTPELLEPFSDENLSLLMIDHNELNESMFEIIGRMKTLETICVSYASALPTSGVVHLRKLKNLKTLVMPYSKTEPDAITEISQLKQLKILSMAYCPIGKYQDELI
jgi:hypothetical protein